MNRDFINRSPGDGHLDCNQSVLLVWLGLVLLSLGTAVW